MGTSFLPIAAGHQLAGWLSGGIFEKMSDKYYLLTREIKLRGLSIPEISDSFSKNDFWREAASALEMNSHEMGAFLWKNYHPWNIWYLFSGIAVLAMLLLWLYDRFIIGRETT